MIKNIRKLAIVGTLAMVASSQAEAQQAVSVPGTPGWGANSGYPAASPWRRPWPRVGNPGMRGRQSTYRYPTATRNQAYTAPAPGYYYYYPSTTPVYIQAAPPVYAPATPPTAPAQARPF